MLPLEKPEHLQDAKAWRGEASTWSLHTYGVAGERFFRTLMEEGRLTGTVCTQCGLTYVPPRTYCERCFVRLEAWTNVPSTGTVETFTVLYQDLDGNRLDAPQIMALVKLDGATGGLVHRLDGVRPEEVAIGVRVRMVLKPRAQRRGGITDIQGFRPLARGISPAPRRVAAVATTGTASRSRSGPNRDGGRPGRSA